MVIPIKFLTQNQSRFEAHDVMEKNVVKTFALAKCRNMKDVKF